MNALRFTIPGRAKSAANLREHHFEKARRVKAERAKAMTLCPRWRVPLLVVTLWRYGVRELDGDNLQGAMKAFRDGIAARLRVDDGSPLVRWEYGQATCAKGEERVEVTISPPPPRVLPERVGGTPEGRTWNPTAEEMANSLRVWSALPTAATYRKGKDKP